MRYNWEFAEWPNFTFEEELVSGWERDAQEKLATYWKRANQLSDMNLNAFQIETIVEEGAQSVSIEGEEIRRKEIRSSLLNNLRFGSELVNNRDVRAKGVADLMNELLRDPGQALTDTTVRYWHELLFRAVYYPGVKGSYRIGTAPMQIISGPEYKQTVHYEAPPANAVPAMMNDFYKSLKQPISSLLKAGISHIYFESIHPFSDGNGRIGRAIMERILLEPMNGKPLLSISLALRKNRDAYYEALRSGQHSMDITNWLKFYFKMVLEAIRLGDVLLEHVMQKVAYFDTFADLLMGKTEKAIRKMWETGPEGFEGGMTTKKYSRITGVSPATATRDLTKLSQAGALIRRGAGRSVHYVLPSG